MSRLHGKTPKEMSTRIDVLQISSSHPWRLSAAFVEQIVVKASKPRRHAACCLQPGECRSGVPSRSGQAACTLPCSHAHPWASPKRQRGEGPRGASLTFCAFTYVAFPFAALRCAQSSRRCVVCLSLRGGCGCMSRESISLAFASESKTAATSCHAADMCCRLSPLLTFVGMRCGLLSSCVERPERVPRLLLRSPCRDPRSLDVHSSHYDYGIQARLR